MTKKLGSITKKSGCGLFKTILSLSCCRVYSLYLIGVTYLSFLGGCSVQLFHFDVHEDVRTIADATIEKDEVHFIPALSLSISYIW